MFFRHLLLLVAVVCFTSMTVDGSDGNCGINRDCCTAKANCDPGQQCACSGFCSGSQSACECHCEAPSGTSCARLKCHIADISVRFEGGPLAGLLETIQSQMGLEVTAPSFAGRRFGRFHREGTDAGELLHDLGRALGAVPIYRGASAAIELIPRGAIRSGRFSTQGSLDAEPMTAEFSSMSDAEALMAIARFASVDLVFPRRSGGRIDGALGEGADWREVMQMTLDRSGEGGRIVVHPNGLAEVKGW